MSVSLNLLLSVTLYVCVSPSCRFSLMFIYPYISLFFVFDQIFFPVFHVFLHCLAFPSCCSVGYACSAILNYLSLNFIRLFHSFSHSLHLSVSYYLAVLLFLPYTMHRLTFPQWNVSLCSLESHGVWPTSCFSTTQWDQRLCVRYSASLPASPCPSVFLPSLLLGII